MKLKSVICAGLALILYFGGLGFSYAEDFALLVGGAGKEPKYSKEFSDALSGVRNALLKQGYFPSRIRFLAEKKDSAQGVNDIATKESITRDLKQISSQMKTSDTLLLIMVGHGQSDYVEPKFNLPGPDLTAQELATLLDSLPAHDQRIVFAFACSGHFSEFLAAPSRLILASSDGPRQIYHTVMAQYFAPALVEKKADINGDNSITFYELYQFLTRQVDDYYKSRQLIQTENPSLEDNGDGEPTTAAEGMDSGDGDLAKRLLVLPVSKYASKTKVMLEKQ